MKPSTQLSLTIVSLLITSACDEHDPIDAELEAIEAHGEQGEQGELDVLEPLANADETISTLTCDLDEQAEVGGLHYPNTTCADAIANAESKLGSWHYRNACNLKIGSDISSPAAAAVVTDCYLDLSENVNAVVSVGLCCEPPPPPRIAYWQGKVNAHRDSGGTWLADPDCTSGAQIDPLVYCTQLYPATTSVTAVPLSTKPEHLWNTAGCGAQYSGNGEQEWTCNP